MDDDYLVTGLIIFLLWGIGHPAILNEFRKHGDVNLAGYFISIFLGIFGIVFIVDRICDWLCKCLPLLPKLPNPILLKKFKQLKQKRFGER